MRHSQLAQQIDDHGRRSFLSHAAKMAFGLTAAPLFTSLAHANPIPFVPPKATRVIHLFLAGGLCHFDSFDPKPSLAKNGATKAIGTSADSQFSEMLPELAKHAHDMTVIRSMNSNQGAHQQGQYYMRTGYQMRGTSKHPILGSWADAMLGKRNQTLPGSVVVGGPSTHPAGGFLPTRNGPLLLGGAQDGLPNSRAPRGANDRRHQLLAQLEAAHGATDVHEGRDGYRQLYAEAVELMKSRDLKAFNINEEDPKVRAEYGETKLGLGCLLARRLVEHQVRFVEVTMQGWDTHSEHSSRIGELSADMDRSVSTLLRDLKRRGLLDSTVVMITSEFGRTPDLNLNDGRDHYPSVFSCALAGGPFKRGYIHGSSDDQARGVDSKKVLIPDLHATVAHSLGLPLDHILYSPEGRPFTVADKGKVVNELYA